MASETPHSYSDLIYNRSLYRNADPGAFSTHTHSMYEIIYFLKGDATHVVEDRKYKLNHGDLIVIKPYQYHFIKLDSKCDYERYDILFDFSKHGLDGEDMIGSAEVTNQRDNNLITSLFDRLDQYSRLCSAEDFKRLLPHLITELIFLVSLSPKKEGEVSSASPMISEALSYINANLCTLTGVDQIAKKLFVSESYLHRVFKNELHQTPKKYIRDKRLLLAQKMILKGQKPINVYETCCFSDYTAFYRNYISFFGYPPSREKFT